MERILVLGGGGREHAIGWKLAQSKHVEKVYFAPGNGGTTLVGENLVVDVADHKEVIKVVHEKNITFVVVTPDDYLAAGMVDALEDVGVACFGPTQAAAKIEWSKAFAKEVMISAQIPTARHASFTSFDEAKAYTLKQQTPIVVKASGLALGKGVVIANTHDEAIQTLSSFMQDEKHGEAGKKVVIEECLEGQEFSIHAFVDGKNALLLPSSQDHKRAYENDEGPNTGGMGTIAPLPWVTQEMLDIVYERIVEPLVRELQKRETPFKGLLYPGLMWTSDGPKVIEFNARFGDPETQSYMRLLNGDLFELMQACREGNLANRTLDWHAGAAACVVLASGGYPGKYEKGKSISGLTEGEQQDNVVIFHAGTTIKDSSVVTNGGRVLNVTATGSTLKDALSSAYTAIGSISFEGMEYRKDIGEKSL